jgi:hypothetical protein
LAAGAVALARPRAGHNANPRTGLLSARDDELLRAVRKKDRSAIERLAQRMGPARIAEALRRPDNAVVGAALVALPFTRGAATLVGTVADLLDSPDAAVTTAAASALGGLLDGTQPSRLDEWEVPPDQVVRACGALRALAARVEAPVPSRLAALAAIGDAATVCTATGELATLLRDPVPAVRRATALVLRPDERRASSAFRDVIHDPDPGVAAAAIAAICRADERGAPDPTVRQATAAARVLVLSNATAPEDAVEMLGCLARAPTPADLQILDQLRRGAPSPLRDRAVELGTRPAGLGPR